MPITPKEAYELAKKVVNTVDYDIYKETLHVEEEDPDEVTLFDDVADVILAYFNKSN